MPEPYLPSEAEAVWDTRAERRGLVGTVCTDHLGTKIWIDPWPGDRACGWFTDPEYLSPLDGRALRALRRTT